MSNRTRYTTFALAMGICLCAGTLYSWATINKEIKADMGFDAKGIATIYSLGAVGQYLGIPPGRMFDRFGPRVTLCYAAVLTFTGYLMMHLQMTTKFSTSPVLFGFFFMLVGQGSIGMYMPALLTNVRNFPAINRGLVVGLMAAGFGLSSALFTGIYSAFFKQNSNVEGFLLMSAILLGSIDLLGALVLKIVGPPEAAPGSGADERPDAPLVRGGDSESADVESGVAAPSPGDARSSTSPRSGGSAASGGYGSTGPLGAAPSAADDDSAGLAGGAADRTSSINSDDNGHGSGSHGKRTVSGLETSTSQMAKPAKGVDAGVPTNEVEITGMQLLYNGDYIVMFFLFGLGAGAGLMVIGEISLIAESNHFSDNSALGLIVLMSACNCGGRILFGTLADVYRPKLSNAFFMMICVLVLTFTHGIFILVQGNYVLVAAGFNGLAYGGMFAMIPKFISERFGVKVFGFNFGVATLALAAGNMSLSAIAGAIYDSHEVEGQTKCYGTDCFQTTFIISTCCCAVAVCLAFVLSRRARAAHQRM